MISFLGTEDRVIYNILKTHSQNDFEKNKKKKRKEKWAEGTNRPNT